MHFRAKTYQHIEVADHNFRNSASMKIVSKEEMTKFLGPSVIQTICTNFNDV